MDYMPTSFQLKLTNSIETSHFIIPHTSEYLKLKNQVPQ